MRNLLHHQDFQRFGLTTANKDTAWGRGASLILDFINTLELELLKIPEDEREEFLESLHYYSGVLQKYLMYKRGFTEGQLIYGRVRKKWVRDVLQTLKNGILDHLRRKRRFVVAHPYCLNKEQLRRLVDYVYDRELELLITGRSEYFPGNTMKIILGYKRRGR